MRLHAADAFRSGLPGGWSIFCKKAPCRPLRDPAGDRLFCARNRTDAFAWAISWHGIGSLLRYAVVRCAAVWDRFVPEEKAKPGRGISGYSAPYAGARTLSGLFVYPAGDAAANAAAPPGGVDLGDQWRAGGIRRVDLPGYAVGDGLCARLYRGLPPGRQRQLRNAGLGGV